MKKKLTGKCWIFILVCLCLSGCFCAGASSRSVSVVTWNVQTFFDANTSGSEYSDFIRSKQWGVQAYEARLKRLCEVMRQLDADVYVFEEIENKNILIDISNRLSGNSWNQGRNWNYAFFAKNEGGAIGCAVLSRFPLAEPTVHNLDVRTEQEKQPEMRPLIRLTVLANGTPLVLFVNHWKSKSGGAEKTEVWRNWQESLLSSLMKKDFDGGAYVLAAGDFNRDISEFSFGADCDENSGIIMLGSEVPVYSPWFFGGVLAEPGSYYYDGSWERIDHFFASQNIAFLEFRAATGVWCEDSGIPARYKIYTGQGYSDHLPLFCRICLD